MSNIKIFNHRQFGKVRTIYNEKKDEIWFVARDVSKKLGYTSIERMYDHVDKEDKIEINPQSKSYQGSCENGSTLEPNPNIFRMILINESGLYSAIFGSQLPQAKEFKKWVTSEVLPSIRKHGAYMTESTIDKLINNPDLVIGLATKLKEEQEQRKKAEDTIKLQTPKVKYFDKVLDAKGSKTTTQVAKLLGLRSAIQLNNILHELGIQYKQSGQWLLYSQYADKGYTETSTHLYKSVDGYEYASKSTKWTEKGIHFIYEQLGKHGLLEAI